MASSTSPSPLTQPVEYDVFLSFRGPDTRTKFTDHLYHALQDQRGIPTFRDSEQLEKGEDLSQLFEAIEKSKIAVVILSSNYASSIWCLQEVAKIVECRNKSGLIVLPVFYDIEPAQVRYQSSEKFKQYFDKHEQRFKHSIKSWRQALTEVADLSGWHLKDRSEVTVIDEIVKCVDKNWKHKFNLAFSTEDSKDFVGMDRVRKIELDLDIKGLDNIGVIGICGMPGVGKTTIAAVVFRRNWHHFEANSFIANVGETHKKNGLLHLQNQLYHDLLESKVITMSDVPAERRKLLYKKVLIILDGVTELKFIEELVGRSGGELVNWFGRGSRIIITTIDEKLLKDYGAKIHKVGRLTENEARLLFFRKAFKNDHPLHDFTELDFKSEIDRSMRQYADLSYSVVDLADGLPLAIVAMGNLLLNRTLDQWEAELCTLKANTYADDEKTFGILKACINGLRDGVKEIFLDIACFFKGDDKIRAERIFESCGHNPSMNLNILLEKSLVTIVRGKLWMHDILQETGRKMVIEKSELELGKRSRLWHHKEAISVLKQNNGTNAVRGIFLCSPRPDKVQLKADSFWKMDFLRLLKIKNVIFPECLEYELSNELSFMEWHGFPSTSLPSKFEPEKLVELHLPQSQIKQLWKDITTPPLERLVILDLSDCKYLTSSPDFQSVPNLESLILKGCTRLSEVQLPIGDHLQKLMLLNLEGCESLNCLPNGICSLRSLTTLILSGCSKLPNLPENIGENMKKLSKLDLEGTAIKGLPASIKNLIGLIWLNLRECKNLLSLPAIICSLENLQVLNLSGCSNLDELPENLGSLVGLKELDASRSCIRQVPSSILLLKDLESVSFRGCGGLQLPASFSGLDSLTKLDLSYCKLSDRAIPADLDCLSSLVHLNLSGNNLVRVPESIAKLSKLEVLLLNDCRRLRSLPDRPPSIQRVFARNCPLPETYSNKLMVWTSKATGFCFINSQTREERKLHKIPLTEKQILQPNLQKFYEDIIYKGNGFEYITRHTKIPSWFDRQREGSSITFPLPQDIFDGELELMGFALCFVSKAQKELTDSSIWNCLNVEQVKYSCNYRCRLSTCGGPDGDCLLLECKLMDHDYVESFRHWVYIPGGLFAERLNNSYVRAQVIIDRPGVEVKACGASLIYSGCVKEFVWNLNLRDEIPSHIINLLSPNDESNEQEQETTSDDELELKQVPTKYRTQMFCMISLYDTQRSKKQSLDHDAGSSSRTGNRTQVPHQRSERPESNDQFNEQEQGTNSQLTHVAEVGCASDSRFLIEIEPHTSRDNSTSTKIVGDQLGTKVESFLEELFELDGKARRYDIGFIFSLRAILPWFNHQSIGNVFIREKERIGSAVGLPLPPELYNNKKWVGFALYVSFTLPPGVFHEKSCCFKSVLCTGDGNFHCLKLRFDGEDNFMGSHRLLVIHIPRGHFKEQLNQCSSIHAAFVSLNPSVVAEMCGIRVVYEHDLKGLIQTLTQCTIRSPPAVYYGLAGSYVTDGRESFMLALMEDNLIEAAKSSERGLSTLQGPLRDSKFINGEQICLKIQAGTPYLPVKNKVSVVEWKRNLELLLECFFTLSDLSVNLTLNASTTSFSRDFGPRSGIFLQKEIPEWFTPQHPSDSMVPELPANLENDVNFMGLVVCAAFSVHASEVDVLKYLKSGLHPQLMCYFQYLSSDQSYGFGAPMIDTSPRNKFMWLYRKGFIWQEYLPRDVLKDLLLKDTSVKISFSPDSISSDVLGVQKCSFRILYKQDLEKFKQTMIQCFTSFFDNEDVLRAYLVEDPGDYTGSNHYGTTLTSDEQEYYGTTPYQGLERPKFNDQSNKQQQETNSELTHVAEHGCSSDTRFLIEIEPHSSRDNSTPTKIVGDQLRTTVESFLEELFELEGKACSHDLGFIFSLRAILPWFKHQGIGSVIGIPLPRELYNNKECIGFSLYATFTLSPSVLPEEDCCFIKDCCLITQLFTDDGEVYCLKFASIGHENFMGSHRLLVIIHIPRSNFGEQMNQFRTIRASFESLTPGLEVEMCGMRVVYQQDLKGLIQTITNCTMFSPPGFYALPQTFVPGMGSYMFTHRENSMVAAAKSSERRLSTLQEPSTDLKTVQGIQLLILAETPFTSLKKTDSVIEWKRNLKLLLQCFLNLSDLSISLILRGGRISFSEDHNLHSGIYFQKEIPEWFTAQHPSDSMLPELPPDLENDANLIGFVVCAAFSVQGSEADVREYLDSGHHPQLMCHFISSSESSGVQVSQMVGISPRNKFMWLYRRGFIWLQYIPRHNVEHLFNKLFELQVSFKSDSSQVLAVQKCSFRFLYKQDVEGFKQTMIGCFASFFDNEDVIRSYIEEEYSAHNKPPNHADDRDSYGTTNSVGDPQHVRKTKNKQHPGVSGETGSSGGNTVSEQTHNESIDMPTEGEDSPDVSADERDYYGTTQICQGETSGKFNDQLELVAHVVEEERASTTNPAELIPFLFEIEPSASTDSSSTNDSMQLITHNVVEEHGSGPALIPFFIEIEPPASTDSSSTKIGRQLPRNIESSLEQLFQGDNARHYNYGFILSPRVGAVMPWFKYHSIGKRVEVTDVPRDLYKDKKWVGFALYVAFTQSSDSNFCCMSRCAFQGNTVHSMLTCRYEGQFSRSRRLCFIHIPRARFPQQGNQCGRTFAQFDFSPSAASEVEMCGIRVVYDEDIEGLVQTITQSTITSMPHVFFSQDDGKTKISISGHPVQRIRMAASLVAHSKACIQFKPIRRTLRPPGGLGLLPPLHFGKVHLAIHGDTPFKKKNTIEWKKNFERLLQSFFRLDLSIQLILGEDTISLYLDLFQHTCFFPQKEIPDWFIEKSPTSTFGSRLPDDLESDNNWMGYVACAAFSLHAHPTDMGNYKDSQLSSNVKCIFRWSSNSSQRISLGKGLFDFTEANKFKWLSCRGFIWLQFIPCEVFRIPVMNKSHRLEASFESDSPALAVQKCSLQILYKKDVQEYKQTMVQCFASVFDNLDHSQTYNEDDSLHNKEPMHEDDQIDSVGTTSLSEDTLPETKARVLVPQSEISGNSFSRFNSILFEPISYDKKSAVIFADFRGWEE